MLPVILIDLISGDECPSSGPAVTTGFSYMVLQMEDCKRLWRVGLKKIALKSAVGGCVPPTAYPDNLGRAARYLAIPCV